MSHFDKCQNNEMCLQKLAESHPCVKSLIEERSKLYHELLYGIDRIEERKKEMLRLFFGVGEVNEGKR